MWMELNIINCSVAAAAAKSLLLHISALNLLDLIVLFCKYCTAGTAVNFFTSDRED